MYLTQVNLNAIKADGYSVHQKIWEALFPSIEGNQPFVFMNIDGSRVLVYSDAKPEDNDIVVSSRKVTPEMIEGRTFRFHCSVSPVLTKGDRKMPMMISDRVDSWFTRRISGATLISYTFNIDKKKTRRKASEFMLANHHFDGLIHVDNASEFIDLIKSGIGGKKAFGYGLMALSPA